MTIYLYNEARQELTLERVYLEQHMAEFAHRMGKKRSLSAGNQEGISGRAVRTKKPQLVPDVSIDPDYIACSSSTKSELTAPMIDEVNVLGVITVHAPRASAFDDDDLNTLEALASLAAIAIKNAQQYEELRRAKGLVGARTALAWMGMVSSAWRHGIAGKLLAIRGEIEHLNTGLAGYSLESTVLEHLSRMDRMAKETLERPVTPALTTEESVHVTD